MKNAIVFDIETLAIVSDFQELDEKRQEVWEDRCDKRYDELRSKMEGDTKVSSFYQGCWEKFAALIPEYSKILCISVGYRNEAGEIKTKTYQGGDEKAIIENFFKVVTKFIKNGKISHIAGHNIKNFDIPFIIKRAMINGIRYYDLPPYFQITHKKPWDLDAYIIDTKELWAFTSWSFKSSLDEACVALEIDSPKDGEVKGEEIYNFIYHEKGEVSTICDYCERDVVATINLLDYFYDNLGED